MFQNINRYLEISFSDLESQIINMFENKNKILEI